MFDRDRGVCEGMEALVAMLACRGLLIMVIIGLLAGPNASGAGEGPAKAAVFDFELIDTSLEGEMRGKNAAEQRRLGLISDFLRRRLRSSGDYMVLDMSSAAKAVKEAGHLYGCNGCDRRSSRSRPATTRLTSGGCSINPSTSIRPRSIRSSRRYTVAHGGVRWIGRSSPT